MRGLRAVLLPRGLGHLEFPGIPNFWAECARMIPSRCKAPPVLLRLLKSTCFSFVPGVPAAGTCLQVLLFRFPSIQHTTHCVSALLVRMTRAEYSAVLGSLSLLVLTPLLPPGSWGRHGARVLPGCGLYLTPFVRCWVLAGVDVAWLLYCIFWSLF